MGLASTPDMKQWKVITDLQDLEDGEGGMDFKITGTKTASLLFSWTPKRLVFLTTSSSRPSLVPNPRA